jgi:hypothetical protein
VRYVLRVFKVSGEIPGTALRVVMRAIRAPYPARTSVVVVEPELMEVMRGLIPASRVAARGAKAAVTGIAARVTFAASSRRGRIVVEKDTLTGRLLW